MAESKPTPDPNRRLGDIASKLLFENDRVRVWQLKLAPGEETPIHQHHLDHLLVQIDGDRIAVQPEPDTKSVYRDYLEADVFPGQTLFVDGGGIERAKNVGARPFHEIVIELKD